MNPTADRRPATSRPARAGAAAGRRAAEPPQRVVDAVAPAFPRERLWLVRALGARMLVQHGAVLARPEPRLVAAGAAVDLLHAASMVPFLASPRYGRAARISGGLAAAYAAVARGSRRGLTLRAPGAAAARSAGAAAARPRPAPSTARRRAAAPAARAAGRRGHRRRSPVTASAPRGHPAPPAPPAAATIACGQRAPRRRRRTARRSATSSARISTSSRTAACARPAAGSTGSAASQATNGSRQQVVVLAQVRPLVGDDGGQLAVVQLGDHPGREHQQRPGAGDAEGHRRGVLQQPGVRQLRRRPDDQLQQLRGAGGGCARSGPTTAASTPSSSSGQHRGEGQGDPVVAAHRLAGRVPGDHRPDRLGQRVTPRRQAVHQQRADHRQATGQPDRLPADERDQRVAARPARPGPSSAGTGQASSAARTARAAAVAGSTVSGCERRRQRAVAGAAARAASAPRRRPTLPTKRASTACRSPAWPSTSCISSAAWSSRVAARPEPPRPRVVVDDEALLLQPGQHRVHGGQRDARGRRARRAASVAATGPSAAHSRSMTARSSSPSEAIGPPVVRLTPRSSTCRRKTLLLGVERMCRSYDGRRRERGAGAVDVLDIGRAGSSGSRPSTTS